jgi:8-amino-7-oxononanoate synthase
MTNYDYVSNKNRHLHDLATRASLMHGFISKREGSHLYVNDKPVLSFASCSYLGLETNQDVVNAGQKILENYGTNFCAARTRLSIKPLFELEQGLSKLMGAKVITFPSLTITHFNILPILSSGILFLDENKKRNNIFIIDRFAHASMKCLIPFLKEHSEVKEINHNDMETLKKELHIASAEGKNIIYICDSIYSMGSIAPLPELIELLKYTNFYLYIDDAHGTSIFGKHGEGYVLSQLKGEFPERMFLTFSLSKAYGCNGGGIAMSNKESEMKVRSLGMSYQFSGGLDFAAIGSALEVLKMHESGEIESYQKQLWENVSYFDSIMDSVHLNETSPIRMIHIGDELDCIKCGEYLFEQGYFVPTVFFPVVPQAQAQLRICLSAQHTKDEILKLTETISFWLKHNKTSLRPLAYESR